MATRWPILINSTHPNHDGAAQLDWNGAARECFPWVHGCMGGTDARCAPAAADALWIRVARACSAHADDGCVAGIDRQDVREHRGHAGELLRERFEMYLFTIESVPFINENISNMSADR